MNGPENALKSAGPAGSAEHRKVVSPRMGWKSVLALAVILLAALGIRLGYVMSLQPTGTFRFPDEEEYWDVAEQFVGGHGLRLDDNNEVQRAPVYPLFLAVIQRLRPAEVRPVWLAQAVVGMLVCGALFLLARELAGIAAALAAAAIAAIYPLMIYFTGLVLSETLFALFFLLAFYLLVRAWKHYATKPAKSQWVGLLLVGMLIVMLATVAAGTAFSTLGPASPNAAMGREAPSGGAALMLVSLVGLGVVFIALAAGLWLVWRSSPEVTHNSEWIALLLMAGVFAALAVLTRPEALAVFVLVPAAWLIAGPRRIAGLVPATAFVLMMLLGMSPWVARNYKRTTFQDPKSTVRAHGHLVLTTLRTGKALYDAVGPFATGGPLPAEATTPPEVDLEHLNEWQRSERMWNLAVGYICTDPRRTFRLALVKLRRTWNIFPNWEGAQQTRYRIAAAASFVPVALTAIVGLFVLGVRRPRNLAWVLLPVLTLTGVHMIFMGSIRYRLSMIPFVMILSGAAIAAALGRSRTGSSERADGQLPSP